ncbi:MAG TPA: hypothetical protein VFK52_06855 [Nocardioidaceae bacterium]|nr:hypothetical protein [Nocardioidaceae bacterium]
MTADAYCDFCDLPLAQCIHGQPPPVAAPAEKPASRVRRTTTSTPRASSTPARTVVRRWTPPEVFKPLILAVLEEAGGELEADDLFLELEIAAEDVLSDADREKTPEGELRWQYAARRARLALVDEGLMTKGKPGFWSLAR